MIDNSDLDAHFRKIYHTITPSELTQGLDQNDLNLHSILTQDPLFLDFYSHDGIQFALNAYGFLQQLRLLGISQPLWTFHQEPNGFFVFRLFDTQDKKAPLLDVALERTFTSLHDFEEIPVLKIGWLELRNPNRNFSQQRPPLPGQRAPGLGIGRPILSLLKCICARLSLQAIVTEPAYLHNAILYASDFDCLDPNHQGNLFALVRDLPARCLGSIAYASWAMFLGHVRLSSPLGTQPSLWHEPLMISFRSKKRHNAIFSSVDYLQQVNLAMCRQEYRVNSVELANDLCHMGILPLDLQRLRHTMRHFGWL